MNYISTRDLHLASPYSFSDILLEGLAADGGLYVPEQYPRLTDHDLTAMRSMSYPELAFAIISRFVSDHDIPHPELKAIIDQTYRAEVFGYTRHAQDARDITPILTLEDNLHLLSLSNGPTLAFKDIAMQLLGNLFEYVLAREGRTLNILGATSGDTGSAAEYALRGKRGVNVFMLSPYNRMSPFQTAQMYSLQDSNIFNLPIDSDFDYCQALVKRVFADAEFKQKYQLGAVNSINWARIVAQVVYYFKGYFAVTHNNAQKVNFTVPSGNFGNAYAGYVAKRMGLPIDKIVVATNENDVLHELFTNYDYKKWDEARMKGATPTTSPSMDITNASNFERLLFDMVMRQEEGSLRRFKEGELPAVGIIDGGLSWMINSGFDPSAHIKNFLTRTGFCAGRSVDTDRVATIRQVWDRYHVMIDPHTADGMKAALEHREAHTPMLVLETALPAKFESIIQQALGMKPERPAPLQDLENRPCNLPLDWAPAKVQGHYSSLKEFIKNRVERFHH